MSAPETEARAWEADAFFVGRPDEAGGGPGSFFADADEVAADLAFAFSAAGRWSEA
jgi:hypothetical protein